MTDDLLQAFKHCSHVLAQVSDAEVVLVAIVVAMYFQNHHERALCVMRAIGYSGRELSLSRFNRRLHQLAGWLVAILAILGEVFQAGGYCNSPVGKHAEYAGVRGSQILSLYLRAARMAFYETLMRSILSQCPFAMRFQTSSSWIDTN